MNTTPSRRILVVDDDASVVDFLCESLVDEGYSVEGATSSVDALSRIKSERYDMVITDVEMPELRGVDLLKSVLEAKPTQLVLLITAHGNIEMAVESVRAGACDFLTKPFRIEALLHSIERAFNDRMLRHEIVRLRSQLTENKGQNLLVAKSPQMRRSLEIARRAAATKTPVLLTGETGSGKSILAHYIHQSSARRKEPFVQFNCAAVPPSLLESELFGAKKGAFTDARENRDGLFVSARGGTLFLDEIGELSVEAQAKLLLALETNTIRQLGGTTELQVKARVITATNRDPEALLREGRLRPDLYYRINVMRIEVPPLRERKDDIIPLVDTFLARATSDQERSVLGISSNAIKLLMRYSWPGNIRELANVIERAVAMAEHDTIMPDDLGLPTEVDQPPSLLESAVDERLSLEELERAYVRRVVDAVGGNKAAAAAQLGITRRTLYRKLRE